MVVAPVRRRVPIYTAAAPTPPARPTLRTPLAPPPPREPARVDPTPTPPVPTTATPQDLTKVTLTGDQSLGLAGFAPPGSSIEAINLSTAPSGRLHTDETTLLGKVDTSGRFAVPFAGQLRDTLGGDVIRIRARKPDGSVTGWITINADRGTGDERKAVLAHFRISLTERDGSIAVTNLNTSRQISEPGAELQLRNTRTGETTQITLDDEGSFPANTTLPGKAGDTFKIAISDGKNNTSFANEQSFELTATKPGTGPTKEGKDLPDPLPHKEERGADGKSLYALNNFTGPLFVDGVKETDPVQGNIGDCYFPAGMAAIAKNKPQAIEKMIKDNGDGTYAVTFYGRGGWFGSAKKKTITVDGDLYVRSYGGTLYGHASALNDEAPDRMELWFALVEKAYAQMKGDYDTIGSGGPASDVFFAVLGVGSDYHSPATMSGDELFKICKSAVAKKRPAGLGTHKDGAKYVGTGVHADHLYSLLDVKEESGVKYLRLRNPWGENEPEGDGADDGMFWIKADDAVKLFANLSVAKST